jgi:hypothetical protein
LFARRHEPQVCSRLACVFWCDQYTETPFVHGDSFPTRLRVQPCKTPRKQFTRFTLRVHGCTRYRLYTVCTVMACTAVYITVQTVFTFYRDTVLYTPDTRKSAVQGTARVNHDQCKPCTEPLRPYKWSHKSAHSVTSGGTRRRRPCGVPWLGYKSAGGPP